MPARHGPAPAHSPECSPQACPPREGRRWKGALCGMNSPHSSSWVLSRQAILGNGNWRAFYFKNEFLLCYKKKKEKRQTEGKREVKRREEIPQCEPTFKLHAQK